MADDWRATLSYVDRYNFIQRLQPEGSDILNEGDPQSQEEDIYFESSTLREYVQSVEKLILDLEKSRRPIPIPARGEFLPDRGEVGLKIAHFDRCIPIADGVTSEVYRTGNSAIKVITIGTQFMEPHSPKREIKILTDLRGDDHPNIIQLLSVHWDEDHRLVLEFPYMPLTLGDVFSKGKALDKMQMKRIFVDILHGLKDIHGKGIIHRDIKPSSILLASPDGPAFLCDFGTAWHPQHSIGTEAYNNKILDIGTGPYRPIDCLFGNKAYDTIIDMWSFGVVLSEALTDPPKPIFESRPSHEDGSQLGLILSIFKTLGTPTKETWPEAKDFKVTPFEMWRVYPRRYIHDILPDVDDGWRTVVGECLRYDAGRLTAAEALLRPTFQ